MWRLSAQAPQSEATPSKGKALISDEAKKFFKMQKMKGKDLLKSRTKKRWFAFAKSSVSSGSRKHRSGDGRTSGKLAAPAKMPVPVAQARKFARKRVAGKLARRDELLLQLLRGF
jgi:hypothetical protein